MPVFPERGSSSASSVSKGGQIKLRTHRNHCHQEPDFPTRTDPSINICRSNKSTNISSFFLSHFSASTTHPDPSLTPTIKKKGAAFRGLGCTAGAAEQVSVPTVIRSSAEWEGKRVKKKKGTQKQKKKKENLNLCSKSYVGEGSNSNNNINVNGNTDCGGMVMPDVWCGPGIGFSADAMVGSVDCVVAASDRRNVSNGRGKIDARERERERDREREKERTSCAVRWTAMNSETLPFLDMDPEAFASRIEQNANRLRFRHFRHPSPDGLDEIMMFRNAVFTGERLDRFRHWRLDIDHMTYEQLLELGDKIGYVNTGLKDDEIRQCVKKFMLPILTDSDKNCSICQEECKSFHELGKLECGHDFHMQCIKQWLAQKNACPVCKTSPVDRG